MVISRFCVTRPPVSTYGSLKCNSSSLGKFAVLEKKCHQDICVLKRQAFHNFAKTFIFTPCNIPQ